MVHCLKCSALKSREYGVQSSSISMIEQRNKVDTAVENLPSRPIYQLIVVDVEADHRGFRVGTLCIKIGYRFRNRKLCIKIRIGIRHVLR